MSDRDVVIQVENVSKLYRLGVFCKFMLFNGKWMSFCHS